MNIEKINLECKEKNEVDWERYCHSVRADFRELKEKYPFCNLTFPPTKRPSVAIIRVIAVDRKLLSEIAGTEKDFLGQYSKELYLQIPMDYKKNGCIVYGAGWVETDKLAKEDIHFFHHKGNLIKTVHGLHICVGTPESFSMMRNVILENVRTAGNMLVAYERIMNGDSDKLELIAYAHGDKGRSQFSSNKRRYISKR